MPAVMGLLKGEYRRGGGDMGVFFHNVLNWPKQQQSMECLLSLSTRKCFDSNNPHLGHYISNQEILSEN